MVFLELPYNFVGIDDLNQLKIPIDDQFKLDQQIQCVRQNPAIGSKPKRLRRADSDTSSCMYSLKENVNKTFLYLFQYQVVQAIVHGWILISIMLIHVTRTCYTHLTIYYLKIIFLKLTQHQKMMMMKYMLIICH